jgi:hypothetical protein
MQEYEVRYLTHAGSVYGQERFRAADDHSAVIHARTKLSSPFGKGHEVWNGARRVHSEVYGGN